MNRAPAKNITQIRQARNNVHPYESYVVGVLPTPITPACKREPTERVGRMKEEERGGVDMWLSQTTEAIKEENIKEEGIKDDEEFRVLIQLVEERLVELEERRTYFDAQRSLLQCAKCDKVMVDPCILDCGHQFCGRCTNRLEMAREDAEGNHYQVTVCPAEDCGKQILFGPIGNRIMADIGAEVGEAMGWKNMSEGFSVPVFGTGEVDHWAFKDAFRGRITPLWQIETGKWALRGVEKRDGRGERKERPAKYTGLRVRSEDGEHARSGRSKSGCVRAKQAKTGRNKC
ncbi:hypothetical protein V5O48_012684 [Marasmius crinis-equi]|uniref:RING-type domain-containing protein n=1 Tax=Marasmius crinis-equi TaxID=585013 RepID=A0ABR3F2H3_9AGAR